MKITSLPFELDRDETRGLHAPAQEIHGVVSVDAEAITVQFGAEGSDAAATHVTRIPLADVESVEVTGGAVKSPRLALRVAREEIVRSLPWAEECLCVLRFRRADAVHAQEFLTEIEIRIAELKARND
jgi:hypothetical protein